MRKLLTRSTLYAAVVAIAVAVWILSGTIATSRSSAAPAAGDAPRSTVDEPGDTGRERPRLRVTVLESAAAPVTRAVSVSAQTQPNRTVEIRAEAEGRVVELQAERGVAIAAGAAIARLDMRDRAARLAEAEALIGQYRLQYEAAERLRSQTLVSESQIAEANARLVAAQAELADIEFEIANTQIRAPFDAVIHERHVEIGDFVRIGDTLAVLVDTDPLIVRGDVTEREIGALAIGQAGKAVLADGREVAGRIRYVAPVASTGTRTFGVELAVPNSDGALRAGISAELRLAADNARGHLVPPSVLTLDDFGEIGLKVLDADDRARFVPVQMLSSGGDGIWVSGLPEHARIIAVGQGFVTDGQLVEPVSLPAPATLQ